MRGTGAQIDRNMITNRSKFFRMPCFPEFHDFQEFPGTPDFFAMFCFSRFFDFPKFPSTPVRRNSLFNNRFWRSGRPRNMYNKNLKLFTIRESCCGITFFRYTKKSVKHMSLTIQVSVLTKPFFGYTKKLELPPTGKK